MASCDATGPVNLLQLPFERRRLDGGVEFWITPCDRKSVAARRQMGGGSTAWPASDRPGIADGLRAGAGDSADEGMARAMRWRRRRSCEGQADHLRECDMAIRLQRRGSVKSDSAVLPAPHPVAPGWLDDTAVIGWSAETRSHAPAYSGETTCRTSRRCRPDLPQLQSSAAPASPWPLPSSAGIARAGAKTIGNFRVDLTRATLWILLPICLLAATLFLSQGVIQNFHASSRRRRSKEAAEDSTGSGGVAGGIKEAWHERRRFFNAIPPPLREPDAVHEPAADVPHLLHRPRPLLHARLE